MGSKKKKNLLPSQKNKENDVCKSRSKKSAMSMPEQENFSTGIHNILPSTSGTVQASKKRTKKLPNVSNSQLKPYVDDSTDDDDDDEEMMTPEHKTRLNDSSAELVENMIPDNVLIFLLAKKVLTSYEVDLVKSKGSRMSMNEILISLVRCKSDKAFSVLVETLKKTEQKHLAKLLTSTEKRKRKPGEISVRVDIENTTSSDCKGKEKQMNLDDEMDEMYDVIRSWLCKIKPQDNSREAYKQFKKQFDGTYKRIKKWLKLCKLRKKLCSKGRVLTDITNGSIHLWFHCSTVNGLLDLWEMYTSGKLLHFLQESLITQDIKQKFHLKMVKLKVRIINEEFQQCYQELSGRSFEGNEGVTEEQKAIQPPVSAKVEKRIPRQNMPPKGRKALKEVNSFLTGEKMSDQPQGIPVSQLMQRNLRKYSSDPLPSMSGSQLPFEKGMKNFAASKNIFQLGSVVDESEDSEDVKMMSEEHKKWLQVNRVELVQNLIPDEVSDHLLGKNVLTMSEKDRIKAEGASMNKKLIDTIMCKPDKAFFVFVEALKQTNQPHLANLLSPAKKRKQVSGGENANAKRMVMQSCQTRSPLKTGTVTIVKMELQSEVGEIYTAGSKNILIDQPRKDNLLISGYDQLPSPSANVEVSEKSMKSLPSEVIPQSGSVVDESEDSEDVKMMSEEHKKWLQVNRVELVQNLIPDEVSDHLLAKNVLTMSEKDRIKAERASMNKKLIDTIMCKPDKAFFVFVEALKQTNQPHLANLLSPAKKRKQESDESKSATKKRNGIEPPKSAEKSKCCRRGLSDICKNIAPSEEKLYGPSESKAVNKARRYPLRCSKKQST